MAKTCRVCGLVAPDTSEHCECGAQLHGRADYEGYSDRRLFGPAVYWLATIAIGSGLLTVYLRNMSTEEQPDKHTFRSSSANVEQYSKGAPPAAAPVRAPTTTGELQASGGCVAGRVLVQNKSNDPWTDVKIEVNWNYVHVADGIPPGETYRFLPGIFTTGGGARLDLSSVACKTMDIHATTPSGRAHWNGSY